MSRNPPDSSISADVTLVVFCRRPLRGVGKRRIARDLGGTATLELARHLLETTLEDARSWPGPVIIAPSHADHTSWAAGLLPGRIDIVPQYGGNLGERINGVDQAVRAAGHTRVMFIGSDAPVLTPDYFERARAALSGADVVLGPADDGGVTLMAANGPWPDLAPLPWSTAGLARELESKCVDHGLTVRLLDRRYDVDVAADLERLTHDLARDGRPARRALLNWLRADAIPQPRPGRANA